MDVLERLESMEADKAEMKAGSILHGLGFTKLMQAQQVRIVIQLSNTKSQKIGPVL